MLLQLCFPRIDKMYTLAVYYKSMLRTQIYIPETLHERAKTIARNKRQSLANLYRGFITQGLQASKKHGGDLAALAKLNIKGGPKNLSRDIDKYLYGGKK